MEISDLLNFILKFLVGVFYTLKFNEVLILAYLVEILTVYYLGMEFAYYSVT